MCCILSRIGIMILFIIYVFADLCCSTKSVLVAVCDVNDLFGLRKVRQIQLEFISKSPSEVKG